MHILLFMVYVLPTQIVGNRHKSTILLHDNVAIIMMRGFSK